MSQVPPWVLGSGLSFCSVLAMCAHHFRHPYTLCVKIYSISMIIQSLKIMLLCGSTGIPCIVFGFLHLFYCIACSLQGVPVANNYPVWSYVMITDWYHHLLTVQHTFMLISAYFYWFTDMWHPPVKWLCLVQSILAMALMHAFITPWMILCHKWFRCSFLLL